jgi:hypothetical protein
MGADMARQPVGQAIPSTWFPGHLPRAILSLWSGKSQRQWPKQSTKNRGRPLNPNRAIEQQTPELCINSS